MGLQKKDRYFRDFSSFNYDILLKCYGFCLAVVAASQLTVFFLQDFFLQCKTLLLQSFPVKQRLQKLLQ